VPSASLRLPIFDGNYRLASELRTRGFATGCGPERCNAACCRAGGAYVDVRERDRILAHAEWIQPHLDESQSRDPARWFEPEELLDPDYPSGRCVGTAHVEGRCGFLDRSQRCSLQSAALAHGMHKWALKPMYCALFPLEVSRGVVKLDGRVRHGECCAPTADFARSALDACREELLHLVGAAAVAAFEAQLVNASAPPADTAVSS
jgi:hypothetical protein